MARFPASSLPARPLLLIPLLASCAETDESPAAGGRGGEGLSARAVDAGAHELERGPEEVERGPVLAQPKPIVVGHPCDKPGARYGTAVAVGDVDGDGKLELVVGADGEGAIYVHRRAGSGFQLAGAYQASGPGSCPLLDQPGGFGSSLALGDLDGVAGDEIVVGAPQSAGSGPNAGLVHLLGPSSEPSQGLGALSVSALAPPPGAEGLFGKSLAIGDFDGDGIGDLAVGAATAVVDGKRAGAVVVYFGPVGAEREPLLLPNPAPVDNGNFGHALAAGDWDGDGLDDLVVSAVGNTVDGAELAGQAYVFPAPLGARNFRSLEDPARVEGDAPRFGMHVAQRGDLVAIGSPRKDWRGVEDAGLGVLFRGRALDAKLFPHPEPFPDAILGFRVILADLVGDSRVDLAVASLPKTIGAADLAPQDDATTSAPDAPSAPAKPNRGFWIWDGAEPGPASQLLAEPASADHFCQGVAVGHLWPGGREELVLGDYSWDRKGKGRKDDVGRVVVYRLKP